MSFSTLYEHDGDFEEALDGIPYAAHLRLRVRRRAGVLETVMPYHDDLIGSPQRLHGGVVGALLEIAGAVELEAALRAEGKALRHFAKPIGITIDYLRGGEMADVLARAEVKRLGRRVANVRSEAWQDGPARPIATAHMHFLVVD